MDYLIISITAFLASLLTFYSGFGLGTILLPIFAIWFPVEVSVVMTAIVHLLNNLFKLLLVKNYIDKSVLLRFGVPAILAAFVGAFLLHSLVDFKALYSYELWDKIFVISPIKLTIAVLIIFFTLFEMLSFFKKLQLPKSYLVVGGIASGFFGGLSGHQGALRSIFLVRLGLSKESFIATGIAIACLVDLARMSIYANYSTISLISNEIAITMVALLFALLGALIGNKLLNKITLATVQHIVSYGLILLALALGAGFI